MAKIQFQLRYQDRQAVPNAELIFSCKFKNGESWQSDKLVSDDAGLANLVVGSQLLRRFDWSTGRPRLTRLKQPLAVVRTDGPNKVGQGRFEYTVTVEREDIRAPVDNSSTPPSETKPPQVDQKDPVIQTAPVKIDRFDVSGTVKADDGRPQIDSKIVAVDKGIGKEKILGSTQSDSFGKYRIEYNRADLLDPESNVSNLVLRVYASKLSKKLLASSPMKQAARPHEIINLVVDRTEHRGSSLFEITSNKIESLALDAAYEDLNEDDNLLIAKKTGLDVEQVERFVQSQVIANQSGKLVGQAISAEPIFGMLQAGLTPTTANFAASRDFRLIALLNQASVENWVGKLQAREVVDSMRPARVNLLVETNLDIVNMIRASGANDAQLLTILDAYLRTDLGLSQLSLKLSDAGELPEDMGASVQEAIALLQFTGGNKACVNALANDYGIKRRIELARLTSKDWFDIVGKYYKAALNKVEGDTQKEKIDNLAGELARAVEKLFPTAVFTAQWGADNNLESNASQVYLENNPEFDFSSETLQQYWEQTGTSPLGDVKAELERIERLFQITPELDRLPAFKAMWDTGVNSAGEVIDKGRGRFVKDIASSGINAKIANEIFRKAQRVSSRDILSQQPVPVGSVDDESSDDTQLPARIEPTIAALFGAQGGNGCPHCVSAFSPAAYLLDMLRFLQRAETDNQINGLDLFFLRRSDIANLQLDCENAETVMPYIDLVNEVLEHVVATSQLPFQTPLDWIVEPNLDLQTEANAEDLAAHPEHLNVEAYNRLRSITAPWALPYNLWSDEARTYLKQIGVDRSDLLTTLRADTDPFKVLEVAVNRLNIDATETVILSLPADSDAKRLLIWQTADPVNDLQNLQLFLKRTDLSYEETRDILDSRFVNPERRQVLPVDLTELENATLDLRPEDNDGLLDRFHRFTRLWRKSGWTTLELDSVMQSIVTGDLDENSLANIGICAEIQYQYSTPVEELACWFGNINTYGTDSNPALYQRSFLDGSVNGVVGDGEVDLLAEVFAITGQVNSRNLLVTRPTSTLDKWLARESLTQPGEWELHPDYSPIVMAACKLSADEMTEMVLARGLLPRRNNAVALNLANLSQLFRTASIARSLDLSIQECLDWQRVNGDRLGSSSSQFQEPTTILQLMLGINAQSKAGVSAELLRYALLEENIEGQTPTSEEIDALLVGIRSDLLKTADEHSMDTPVSQEQLQLWFSLDASLVVDETQDDIATLIGMIDGSVIFDAAFQTTLDFLSQDSQDSLFISNSIVNSEERLFLAASEIPLDTALLAQADALLHEDTNLEDENMTELLRIFTKLSDLTALEQSELLLSTIPYVDMSSIPAGKVNDRLQVVVKALFEYWVRTPVVIQRLSSALGVSERHVELLANVAPAVGQPALQLLLRPSFLNEQSASVSQATRAVKRLYRQCALVLAVNLDALEVDFALSHAQQTGLYDFRTPGSAQLLNWYDTVTLHETNTVVQSSEKSLYTVLEGILDGELDEVGAQAELASLFEVPTTDLERLVGADGMNITYPDSYLRMTGLNRLYQACGFARQTGVATEQVLRLVEPILNTEHAGIARAAVRSKYDEASWKEVSEQLREGLRERQRDALLTFILTRGELDLTHEHAYAYYLIDMDMSACYQTTRLKQAIASVQQFVQRILLGLEPGNLSFTREDAIEWQWRKNYRVWEANVRVFIYPQNWLVPELRDDKTQFFNEFEQELMQGEVTNELAETALTHYLEKLHQVSNLEIVGTYEDDEDGYMLYVIARSHNTPHDYFHRTWNGDTWTSWESIDMDVEGDHIVPVLYNNRLYLFWATFVEKVDEEALEETGIQELIEVADNRITETDVGLDDLIKSTTDSIGDFELLISGLDDSNAIEATIIRAHENIIAILEGNLNTYNSELTALKLKLGSLDDELKRAIKNVSYQLVQLNWIVRNHDGWSSKRMVKNVLQGSLGKSPDQFQFLGTTQGGGLTLQVVAGEFDFTESPRETQTEGLFVMSDCSGEMIMVDDGLPPPPFLEIFDDNSGLIYTRHFIEMTNPDTGAQQSLIATGSTLLTDSPDATIYATKPHQVVYRAAPFFLASGERTFFVEMKNSGIIFDSTIDQGILDSSLDSKVKTLRAEPQLMKSSTEIILGGTEKYNFSAHHHPYTCACLRQIRRYGVPGLYSPDPALQPGDDAVDLLRQLTPSQRNFDFDDSYKPERDAVSGTPQDKIDFSYGSSYGQYNWEVFFHIPMLIATRLMHDRKFEQAQNWLHYIFDPTEKEGTGLQKYWKIKPFYYAQMWGDAQVDVEEQLETVDDDVALSLDSMIEQWEQNPFQPFVIARFRIVAFMHMTVMSYLDNLIAWGDSLFKRDTMESINEASQLYVLASSILGERPLIIDEPAPGGETFTVKEFLDGQGSSVLPAGPMPGTPSGIYGNGAQGILGVIEQFCLPYNDRMLDYWDTISDRLFKIRHCLNIDGVFRMLPIFQPPIDPALLVRAAASGLDIGAVLSDLSVARPHYRFRFLLQKSAEMISLVQGLGNQMLSALEKKDAEELARLRSEHEVAILKLNTAMRQDAIKDAEEQILAIEAGREIVQVRREFYASRKYMNTGEELDMVLRGYSWYLRTLSQVAQAAVTPLEAIPRITAGTAGISSPVALVTVPKSADAAKSGTQVLSFLADLTQTAASMSQTMGQFDRRQEDWDHQVALADAELKQFEKQLAAAEIRLAMSEKELANHQKQIEYSEQTHAFIEGKFTNPELYTWMITELSGLYFQAYQLAYDMAKRAERCYQHELGVSNTSFIQFGYWDSMKKGLLAGDKLQLDVKRMESSFVDNNIRELELSKTVSLAMLNPEALLRMTEMGECFFTLPEQLFDLDYPGHYFRRIKSIILTIPAITGPYTTVSCTLTLLSDRFRSEASIGEDDEEFTWNVGSIQSIATSRAQGDSGLFQLAFEDERYLPFERAGVISSWKLNLPRPDLAQFDYSTISDVLIQVNYTARDGGQAYRVAVEDRLEASLNSLVASDEGFPLLMSLKNQFPDNWATMLQADASIAQTIEFAIESTQLPYFLRNRTEKIKSLKLFTIPKDDRELDLTGEQVVLNNNNVANVMFAPDPAVGVPTATFSDGADLGEQSLQVTPAVLQRLEDIKDLMIVCMLEVV